MLKGTFPTVIDMDETGLEIQLLSEREHSIQPQLREVFHAQLRSAESQLRVVRSEMGEPNEKIPSNATVLQRLISKRWQKLNATIMIVEAYCS
jgi:hypothetical protein